MKKHWLSLFVVMLTGVMLQVGCMMPEEGTIMYDQNYPELPTDNVGGSDSGDRETGTDFTAPPITLTPGEQSITVSWTPVDGAVSYNLNWSSSSGPVGEINNVSAQQVTDGD